MPPQKEALKTPGKKTGLHALLAPRSIAVLGASSDLEKLNGRVLKYLRDKDYAGRIFPINPKYATIGDLRCYAVAVDWLMVLDDRDPP